MCPPSIVLVLLSRMMLLALSSVPLMVRIIFGVALFICLSGTNLGEGDDERSSSELVEQPEKEKSGIKYYEHECS